jgi:hypothetical protein
MKNVLCVVKNVILKWFEKITTVKFKQGVNAFSMWLVKHNIGQQMNKGLHSKIIYSNCENDGTRLRFP